MLSTCSVQEFFNFYNSVIPCTYMPSKKVFSGILEKCMHATAEELATYLPKLWSNIYVTCHKDISLVLSFIDLFKTNISLGPTLKATFMNIAQDCWDIIKVECAFIYYTLICNNYKCRITRNQFTRYL